MSQDITREQPLWASNLAWVTSLLSSRPTSTGPKILPNTNLDVGPMGLCFWFKPLTISVDAVELGLVAMGLVVLPIMVFTYSRINARREAIMRDVMASGRSRYSEEELRRMGDKAPNFRYGI